MKVQILSNRLTAFALTAIITVLSATATHADDSLLISYQGRLTDDGDQPVTGAPAMTFTIYTAGGTSIWSETHPTVTVTDGLFSVLLGSQAALPDSVFNGNDRYLGTTVGADPEISPRTVLTSSPGAAVSRRVVGDIMTSPGKLAILNADGDSSIVLEADDEAALSFKLPDGSDVMGVEPSPFHDGYEIKLYDPTQVEPTPVVSIGSRYGDSTGGYVSVAAESEDGMKSLVTMSSFSSGPDESWYNQARSHWEGDLYICYGAVSASEDSATIETSAWNIVTGDTSRVALNSDTSEATIIVNKTQSTGESSQVEMNADTEEAELAVVSTQAAGESAEVKMQVDATRAELILYDSDASVEPAIALRVNAEGGRVGINTNSPSEALDVVGTAQVEALKMPTGAADGHVLTSDADGNGTWQASGGQAEPACAGIVQGATTGSGTFTITYPVTFSAPPYFSAHAVVLSGVNTGKAAQISASTPGISSAQVDIQCWGGASWTDVGAGVQVQVSYTAIDK